MSEKDYMKGRRALAAEMLDRCIRELGPKAGDRERWISERAETVDALRAVCKLAGDNDWPDDLHLADVVNKHLLPYLEE